MLDWIIGGAATLIAGLVAWLGAKTLWLERRDRRERDAHRDAEKRLVDTALRQLRETQKRHAEQPPVRPGRRTDFERPE